MAHHERHRVIAETQHVDAKDRAPAGEEDVERIVLLGTHGFHPVGDRIAEAGGEGGAQEQTERNGAKRAHQPPRLRGREARSRDGEGEPGHHDTAGRRDRRDERNAQGAAEPGPEQIGEVEPVDALGLGGEDRREGEARGEKGDEEARADEGQLRPFAQAREQGACRQAADQFKGVQLDPGHDEIANEDRHAAGEAAGGNQR